jgi:hypothetical protein
MWGGCVCHDVANILNTAVPLLMPNLTDLYSSLHTYLNSASLHPKREYKKSCSNLGLSPKVVPKMLDVRF